MGESMLIAPFQMPVRTAGQSDQLAGDVILAAGRTGLAMLFGQGPILDPLQNLQVLLHDGLRGTTAISLLAPAGSIGSVPVAQLSHPARVLGFTFLKSRRIPAHASSCRRSADRPNSSSRPTLRADRPPSARRPSARHGAQNAERSR